MEHLPRLLESIQTILEDEALEDDERKAMLRQTFEEYRDFTGRDGLLDIAATRGGYSKSEGNQAIEYGKIDRGAMAMLAFEGLAKNLRDREPGLTKEQSFARVYTDPQYSEFAKIERQASRERLIAGYPVARTSAEVVDPDDDDDVTRLITEFRANNPFLTNRQLYAAIARSERSTQHADYRQAVSNARRDGGHAPGPYEDLTARKAVEVSKRDDAMASIQAKATEYRKLHPDLSEAQAFAKIYRSEPALAAKERSAARAAMWAV
jgi:hypothetical protein